MSEHPRVVVTGTGAVSCFGMGTSVLWENLLAGNSGIGPITKYDASAFRCQIAGEVKDFDVTEYMPAKEARRMDAFCHYAIAAADEAVAMAGISADNIDVTRAGVMVGSGVGGIQSLQDQCEILMTRGPSRNSPMTVPMMIVDIASGVVSIRFGFSGPNLCVVTACATGSHSIGEAMWMIRRGDADVMVAGGTEACVAPLGLTGFCAMKALTKRNDEPTKASRPFDAERDGFVPAEGAGVGVLESLEHAKARGAEILAEVVGYGLTGDAHHITAPEPGGSGAARAITNALKGAGIGPEGLDYINAHGTSTPLNDKTETASFKAALGERAYAIPVSSSKSMIGHNLGAAGGLESIVCIQSLINGAVHPTINYENPDPECDLDYVPNCAREVPVRTAMCTNLGFGGHNAALLFKRWE